jgi:hypothetical protein
MVIEVGDIETTNTRILIGVAVIIFPTHQKNSHMTRVCGHIYQFFYVKLKARTMVEKTCRLAYVP